MNKRVSISPAIDFGNGRRQSIALVVGREPSLHTALLSIEPFRAANRVSQPALFSIDFLAAEPGIAPSTMDVALPVTSTFRSGRNYDLVLLIISYDVAPKAKSTLFNWLRRQASTGAHLSGVDAGPLLLAEAGLLEGYTATSHWSTISSLRELSPGGNIVEQLYVIDRNRSTCAGQLATLDFSLEMLRRMCGNPLYHLVCNQLIYTQTRPPEAGQREIVNEHSWQSNPVLLRARRVMQGRLEDPLPMQSIADHCGVSVRELQYLFRRYLDSTPKKIYMSLRLQHAKELLLYSTMSIRETGLASGFASPSAYYRAFHAVYQRSPQQYRCDFITSNSTRYGRNLY
jgi:AraC family carnitine catabolism transcriptional activator